MIGSNYAAMFPQAPASMPVSPVNVPLPRITGNRPAWVPEGVYDTGAKGFTQRLGDALKEPGMSTAMLRGAAASFDGKGIGGSLNAITGSMDQTHARDAGAAQQAHDNELADMMQTLREQTQKQNYDVALGGLDIDAGRLHETGRSNRANEGIARERVGVDKYGIDTGAETARRGQDVSLTSALHGDQTSENNNIRSTDVAREGNKLEFLKPAGIGSSAVPMQTTTTKIPPKSVGGGWFGIGATRQPGQTISVKTPVAAAAGQDEIRYDASGKAYRRDPVTGQPVLVQP
jgi:hypothetical protein